MIHYLKKWTSRLMYQLMQENMVVPPSAVRGMKVLDRNAFQKTINFPALLVPVESIQQCKKALKSHLPSLNMKLIMDSPSDDRQKKLVLLNPGVKMDSLDTKKLEELGVQNKFLFKELDIGYEHFKPRDIFEAILPTENNNKQNVSPKSFCQIGHIIQLNLREHQLPYKKLIGEVFLDKVPTARTVINKVETISSEYRNLDMELLAGEKDFFTRIIEHNRKYELDFSKVFWNSRLSTEHNKMSISIPNTDIVFDVCAGVGPFSIPLAKKGCQVFANDLNPDCHHWLVHNVKLNKVKTMKCFNMDGRQFIQDILGNFINDPENKNQSTVHVIMNLPAIAVEFLDAFPGLLAKQCEVPSVKVYFYIFASNVIADAEDEINSRVIKHLGHPLPSETEIRRVRDIAPAKDQYCVSFVIPKDILCKVELCEPANKKLKAVS